MLQQAAQNRLALDLAMAQCVARILDTSLETVMEVCTEHPEWARRQALTVILGAAHRKGERGRGPCWEAVLMVTAAADAAQVRRRWVAGRRLPDQVFRRSRAEARLTAYARFRAQLATDRTLARDQVDRALRALHGEERSGRARRPRSIPAGKLVADKVRSLDCLITASVLPERLGIFRPTVQRYWADLAADGTIRIELRYGAVGRPPSTFTCGTVRT
ncbi:hypothetical protein [Streptomyces sp. NPDC050355]|uniref:hypothetical protein n=1 Tax=Streptomyces sp. NPDC050355 TaxID=3365609 RepID=UPI0037A42437